MNQRKEIIKMKVYEMENRILIESMIWESANIGKPLALQTRKRQEEREEGREKKKSITLDFIYNKRMKSKHYEQRLPVNIMNNNLCQ